MLYFVINNAVISFLSINYKSKKCLDMYFSASSKNDTISCHLESFQLDATSISCSFIEQQVLVFLLDRI